jgi:3-hydroxyacyl-CoA dehydrogenase
LVHSISTVDIIGSGTMGTQIAIQAACYGYDVKSYDTDSQIFRKNVVKLRELTKTASRRPTRPVEEWLKAADEVSECNDLSQALKKMNAKMR